MPEGATGLSCGLTCRASPLHGSCCRLHCTDGPAEAPGAQMVSSGAEIYSRAHSEGSTALCLCSLSLCVSLRLQDPSVAVGHMGSGLSWGFRGARYATCLTGGQACSGCPRLPFSASRAPCPNLQPAAGAHAHVTPGQCISPFS